MKICLILVNNDYLKKTISKEINKIKNISIQFVDSKMNFLEIINNNFIEFVILDLDDNEFNDIKIINKAINNSRFVIGLVNKLIKNECIYKYGIYDFIDKNNTKENTRYIFKKLNYNYSVNRINNSYILIKGGRKNLYINLKINEIFYVSSLLNYTQFHTKNGIITTYLGISMADYKLKKYLNFIRISRTIIVNFDVIERIDGNSILLKNGENFNIGNEYKNLFHKFISHFIIN